MYRQFPKYRIMEELGELDFNSYDNEGNKFKESNSIRNWVDHFIRNYKMTKWIPEEKEEDSGIIRHAHF